MNASFLLLAVSLALPAQPPPDKKPDPLAAAVGGLKLRSIGPAVTSGRVVGFAVDPRNRAHYYVAVASGGVWETHNAGTTWTPIFDKEGSFSIGVVVLDPRNPQTVWVGTGENNSQRSVSYGDGVYRSDDGGKSWRNVGLKASEHIGRIVIDPRDSNTVYVAAQGPLWGPGGDRGLYKTTDGGKTWKQVLSISENTGVNDVVLDPRNPDVLIASAYQRRRHVWTLINGGPESAIYKSTDAGATWRKLSGGLPKAEMGRIGLAIAPSNPDKVYAIIEAADGKGGIFRSENLGESWEKRNDFDQQAQYYAHIVVDPRDAERVYVMNVLMRVSDDGAKTLRRLGNRSRHVDDHTIWVDPKDPNYYLVGCDGGVYESFDQGTNWKFQGNLPVTQFYDLSVSEEGPFYHVYGGTQDNFTLGGPARNRSVHGITNADWFVVLGGDGFQSRVDPRDPNTIYAEAQYGVLARYDRRTGQQVGIQPQPGKGEPPLRWNWDSPLIISPHLNTRLYFAANRIFRSDDRGDNWTPVSPDLTRQLDRDRLQVMGRVWGPDAVSKHVSTSFYGNIVALAESPKQEGLLYAGTDDGLIQISEDGGKNWRKVDRFPGVPDRSYVSRLLASQHQADRIYACFDNHKNADFAPYVLRSDDRGKSWTPLRGNLPDRGSVLAVAEDHRNPNLLFVGTEFGLFASVDGGQKWTPLKNGLPTIAVRDLAIQRQVDDLVVGTFGRGFYVLDDYSPLRDLKADELAKEATLFRPREAVLYIPTRQYGGRGKGFQGETLFTAENPPFGAVITYHLKETITPRKQKRQEAEKAAGMKEPPLPSKDELRAEAEEEAPTILLTVTDADGKPVRTVTGPVTAGLHRVAWDLSYPAVSVPVSRGGEGEEFFRPQPSGPLVLPGTYHVSLAKRHEGRITQLAGPVAFTVAADRIEQATPAQRKQLAEFQLEVWRLQRKLDGTLQEADRLNERLSAIQKAIDQTPTIDRRWHDASRELTQRLRKVSIALRGDSALRSRNENTPTSIGERVAYIVDSHRTSLAPPTGTEREAYRIAGEELAAQLAVLKDILEKELPPLEKALDSAGAPYTPGRLPGVMGQ